MQFSKVLYGHYYNEPYVAAISEVFNKLWILIIFIYFEKTKKLVHKVLDIYKKRA